MTDMPRTKPANPNFGAGPCAKRPGWSVEALAGALTGRSHRSPAGKARLGEVIARSRALLGMPEAWRLAILPASDTGAVEAALWSLLGSRPVDLLVWDSFSADWAHDVEAELGLECRRLEADYGHLRR